MDLYVSGESTHMNEGEVESPHGAGACPLGCPSPLLYIEEVETPLSHTLTLALICPLVGIFLPLLADPVSRVRCLGETLLKIFSTTITTMW